jgi:hypothetical protein
MAVNQSTGAGFASPGAEYRFVRYRPAYRNELLDLLAGLWKPEREVNEAYFDWKYRTGPYAGDLLVYLALHRGRVVGVDSYRPSLWRAGTSGREYLCLHGGDSIVHPDHRGRGLHFGAKSIAMMELRAPEGGPYAFEITMAANQGTMVSNVRAGGRKVAELRCLEWRPRRGNHRFLDIGRRVLGAFRRRFAGAEAKEPLEEGRAAGRPFEPFCGLDENLRGAPGLSGNRAVLEKTPRSTEMASLCARCDRDGRIRHVRDEEFVAWRYRNPFSAYRFLYHVGSIRKSELDGYLVLQQNLGSRSDYAFIVDWQGLDTGIVANLVQTAVELGNFSSVGIWMPTLPGDLLERLRRLGFSPKNGDGSSEAGGFCVSLQVIPLCAPQGLRMTGLDLLDICNWDLRPIYSDAF